MPSEAGSVLAGKYEVVRALGRGGMGEVYLAQDLRLKRHVAVKYLRGDLPEGNWAEHLRHEALLLAQLNHPNVVQIYDIVEEDGQLALVMEYVEGRNLFLHLREHRVDMGERLRWLAEISAGLAASHEAGVSHCDLKAENVLISPAGTAKVNDFGIASEKTDPAEDIAALGRLAESMLADHRHTLSPAMEELLSTLIDKRPSARPTADQVADKLRFAWYEYYQQETPLPEQLAPPPDKSHHRLWLTLSGVCLAILVGTLLFLREPQATRYVAIAPTEVVQSSRGSTDQAHLAGAITQTLRQSVSGADGLALTSYTASDIGNDLPEEELMATLKADTLLTSRLDCTDIPCQLEIRRFDGDKATKVAHRRANVAEQSALNGRELARREWALLFPEFDVPPELDSIQEDAYREYLELLTAHEHHTISDSSLLQQLASLIDRAPGFAPLYTLFAEVALSLYEATASPALLDALENRLEQAARELPEPQRLNYERFLLALARNDAGLAETLKQALVDDGADPARASYVQAEVLFGNERYSEAMPYFAAASILQPSVRHLRRHSNNAVYADELYEAQHALILLQDLYPQNTLALDILAQYQIGIGRLDLAIASAERSLTLAQSPYKEATLGIAHLLAGNYAAARDSLAAAYRGNEDNTLTLLQLAESEELLGNDTRARELYLQVIERAEAGDLLLSPQAAALAYAHMGNTDKAVELTRSLRRQTTGLRHARAAALVYALLGMNVDALAKIEEAIEAGSRGHYFNLPWYDALCVEPRFVELMAQAENDARCQPRAAYVPE